MKAPKPDEILASGAKTFAERNAIYGDNYRNVGAAIAALHPGGISLETADDFELFHLYMLILVKLSRFANSMLNHEDSIHDVMVYSAMIESTLVERRLKRAEAAGIATVTGGADFDPSD